MDYRVVRAPKDTDRLMAAVELYAPFIASSYGEVEERVYGKIDFNMEQFLMSWDMGHALLVVAEKDGKPQCVCLISKTQDLFSRRIIVDVQRSAAMPGYEDEYKNVVAYIYGIKDSLGYDILRTIVRDDTGVETRTPVV